jgi:MinD superfamily P-loop ATPase
MKQLLILSGKGGTGKTTVAGGFIQLSQAKAFADCDVDAPNLHLVLSHTVSPKITDYFGLPKAIIDTKKCVGCDLCRSHCRFDAIIVEEIYRVDYYGCEGCGVCQLVCPEDAIRMEPAKAGDLMLYREEHVFSTAQLKMGSGTSGMLVTEVKKQLQNDPLANGLVIIDGSPGIGCPVIASISGVDMVLVVAEPSLSGISDMVRILATARKFDTKTVVCVNKHDAHPENTARIETYCKEHEIPFVGKIPYDPLAVSAINAGKTIVDQTCPSGEALKSIFQQTLSHL